MTELELYKFIQENRTEVHIYRNGKEMADMADFNDENYKEWKVYAFIGCADLYSFISLCGERMFEEGFECVLKWKYVAVDLLEIMNYHGVEPKNVFPK